MITTLISALYFASATISPQKKVTVGQLGQSIADCKIYSSMDTDSAVLWSLPAFNYLIINKTISDEWYAVLLENGSNGYIQKEFVTELPYEVELPKDHKFYARSLKEERERRILPNSEITIQYMLGNYKTEKRELEETLPNATKDEENLILNRFSFLKNKLFTAKISGDDMKGTFTFNGKESRLLVNVTHVNGKKLGKNQIISALIMTNGVEKYIYFPSIDMWVQKY